MSDEQEVERFWGKLFCTNEKVTLGDKKEMIGKGMTSEGQIFSQQTIRVTIKEMKENKASDESGVIAEYLKALEVEELRGLMNGIFQTTQPTSGGAVTVVSSCCANCVEPPRPQQWGPDLPFFGHADPLDGWRYCSQKRVMSRPIQVRQL